MNYKYRILFFAIFVSLFLVSFWVGTTYKMPNDQAKEFLKEYQASTHGIDSIGIFLHNIPNALAMFVPGLGIGWGIYNAWSTGAAFRLLFSLTPLSQASPIMILLSKPFGVMEIVSYGMAMSQSLVLTLVLIKKNSLKKELWHTCIKVGIVTAILLAAAFVESSMMSQA